MLKLFTESLGAFLASGLSDMGEKPVVSFALPGAVPGKNALSIFLTGMVENAELRSNETKYERSDTGWIATKPPLMLKCTYVVSAWSASNNPTEASLIQMRLLSAAYHVFTAIKTLPKAYIPEAMNVTGNPKPVIAISKDDLPNRPEFWTSTGCMFHPSFSIVATIALPNVEEQYEHIVEGVQTDYKFTQT